MQTTHFYQVEEQQRFDVPEELDYRQRVWKKNINFGCFLTNDKMVAEKTTETKDFWENEKII